MEKIIVDIEVKSKKGIKEVEKLNKEISKTGKEVSNTKKEMKETNNAVSNLGAGAISSFNKFKGSVLGVVKGFKSLRFAIIATGIGALLIGILAVKTAFTSSEEGQNKFAKLMGVIGSITGNLIDLLANLGEGIISAFENPKQAIIDLKDAIVKNITNRISSLIETFGFLGSAIKKVFSRDFSGALEDAKKAGSSYVDSLTGVKNSIDKVSKATKGFVKELTEEAKIAGQIADQRAKADKLERGLITERAEANRKRAELLDKIADKENFTAKERLEFLKEAGKVEEEITNKEIESAKIRLATKIAENKLSKSTKADLDEVANLEARVIDLQTAKLTKSKLVTAQITGAIREEKAENKSLTDQKKADEKSLQDFKDSLVVKDKNNKLQALETEKETRIKALEDLKITSTQKEQLKLDIENSFKEKKKIIEDEQLTLFLEAQLGRDEQDLARQEAKALAEIDLLGGTEKQKEAIRKKFAKAQADLDRLKMQQTLGDAKNTLNQVSQLAGKDSKIGKAMAIASATISGVEGVQNAYSTAQKSPITAVFPAYPIVQSALAGAIALKNISAIKSINPSGQGGTGSIPTVSGGGSAPNIPSVPSLPPAFNVVGASSTDQLASAIGGQSQQPVQAFVVSGDISTSQELDRNIISGASI